MEEALGFSWPGPCRCLPGHGSLLLGGTGRQLHSFLGEVHGLMSKSAGASSGFAVGLFPTPTRSQT